MRDLTEMSELREAVARRLCTGVPDVECDHIDGVQPSCERDADALLPLIREREASAWERALREAADDVEAALDHNPDVVKQADVIWWLHRRAARAAVNPYRDEQREGQA